MLNSTIDKLNILRKLTIRRVFNLISLYFSYWISRILKKPFIYGEPFSVSIEPTTACNLSCPECPSGLKQFSRKTGRLNVLNNAKILEKIKKNVFYINYYFQGEPFLNPDFLKLISEANRANIYTSTSTNAHFITNDKAVEIVNSGLDRLIISIDGSTQETYEQYRIDGKLSKVLEGSKNIVKARRELNSNTPYLIFQFLVVKPNEHQINDVLKLANEIGIDEVRLKSAQIYDFQNGNPLIPDDEKYARYKKQSDGTYKLKYITGNHCWRMWSSFVLTWDANVVPCCFDKDAKYRLGNLLENNLQEIWTSEKYQSFRGTILTNRNQIDICNNCSEGSKVWV